MADDLFDTRFIALNSDGIAWEDASAVDDIPPPLGEVKVLRRFETDDHAVDLLLRLPPGFVEPRHSHSGEHTVVVLQGRMLVDGKTLYPGDYFYARRDEPHGPFEYPDGVVMYVSHRGDTVHCSTESEVEQEKLDVRSA